MESFGQRLANLRKEHNLTQNDIADKLNVSPQAVSKWENDLTSPDIQTLLDLSEIYNISVDELLGKKVNQTVYLQPQHRKSIDEMMLRIIINSSDGDKVRINFPMGIVKVIVENGNDIVVNGSKALEAINFEQIWQMVQNGMMGELVAIESADGDIVTIFVE
ncbi:MAG: helix-turn-helix domain-containing protein [Erysipelotrichaceae bacterium]